MTTRYQYRVSAYVLSDQRGVVTAEHIPQTIKFNAPPEFNGQPGVWTPEHMLVASLVTCFAATFRGIARASKLPFETLNVEAEGVLEKTDEGLRFVSFTLRPVLVVPQPELVERASRLLEKAERTCLIGRSLTGTTKLEPHIHATSPEPVAH